MRAPGVLALIALLGAWVLPPAPAFAQLRNPPRVFQLADYARFFAPGRMQSHSLSHDSYGIIELGPVRMNVESGQTVMRQDMLSVDVSANYDPEGMHEWMKVRSRSASLAVWEPALLAFRATYRDEEFDAEPAEAWLSHDRKMSLSTDDVAAGRLHAYYREVDLRLGRDVGALDLAYRRAVVGEWRWSCAWLTGDRWEVMCHNLHLPSGRTDTYLYWRADLVS